MVTDKVSVIYNTETRIVELSFTSPGESPEEHDAMAMETKRHFEDLASVHKEGKFKILVDLTNAGIPTKHATDIYISTLSDKLIEKTAIFGLSKTIESIINFIVGASGRGSETRFFLDKAAALEWLGQS